jgi:acetyl-CoA C-acetyltransferase
VMRQPLLIPPPQSRTGTGNFHGALKNLKAPELGSAAMTAAMKQAGVKPDQIEEVYFGNVLQAGVGQSPARQALLHAGCPETTETTTINKVASLLWAQLQY